MDSCSSSSGAASGKATARRLAPEERDLHLVLARPRREAHPDGLLRRVEGGLRVLADAFEDGVQGDEALGVLRGVGRAGSLEEEAGEVAVRLVGGRAREAGRAGA